jgi:hypothetical protein
MTDVKTTSGAKRRGAPLDTTRAERGVWLVKVPQFLAAQWQSETPLTQERDGARSRVEPLLVAALVPVLKCVPTANAECAARVHSALTRCLAVPRRALHARGQLTLGWESVTKAPAFGALLTCAAAARLARPRAGVALTPPAPRLQGAGGGGRHPGRRAQAGGCAERAPVRLARGLLFRRRR